jgi:Carboxypeptidase regulatory-like domain/TonB dependent receptor
MLRPFAASLITAVFLFPSLLNSQVDTGTISGVVKDASGGVIQSAQVKLENAATGVSFSLVTNESGFYSAPDLKAGTYNLSASAPGFSMVNRAGIEVRVQDRVAVDFELPVGESSSSVSVESQGPPLDNASSSLGQVVDERTIKNLPLNGRNYIQLASLGAGTSPAQNSQERNTFIANGARSIQNSYLLDGIDNKNKIVGFDNSSAQSIEPVIDSVQEFKVQTSTFSAEFGQSAGAVVNVTTKSGTNQLHGSAFEFLRNSFFDAAPYFQPADTNNPQLIQNQFGATLGGPIVKDRTFFFFGWQSSREVNAAPQLASVPTDAQKGGIFSSPVYDPATTVANPTGTGYTRAEFPGNRIPVSRFDPISAKLLALYPQPNLTGKNNFFSNQRESVDNDQFVGRVDHRFSDKDSLFGRYSTSNYTNILPATLPPPASSPSIVTPEAHSFAASETHVFTPTLVNEARVGYQETRETQHINGGRLFDQYGIIGAPNIPSVNGLPVFSVTGLNSIGTTGPGSLLTPATGSGNLPIDKQGRTIQVDENLSWVRGQHTVKFGFDFQQVTLYANSTLNARPTYSFSGVYTQNPQNRSATGAAFADFLLGQTSSAIVSTRSISESRQHIYQGYVQDDWRVNSKLTLNLGLRYELPLPFYETANHYSNLILDPGPLYGKLLDASQASAAGYPNSFVNTNWHNFAPRLGFAYQLTPKTVVRAAAGIFYGRDENVPVARRPTNNPPYFIQTTYTSDQIDPDVILSQGFPSNALSPATVTNPSVNSYLRHSPTPYVEQWNFNIQQEVGAGLVAQVAYVGSSSHDLYYPNQIDQPTPGPGTIQARRPLSAYSAVYAYAPLVSASYESLQAQLERRFAKGLSLLAAYTYGHSIDNGSSQVDANVPAPQNAYNFSAERGSSNFDVRQRFVLSSVYELPFGKGKPFLNHSRIGNAVAGGWQLMGIFTAQAGLPFTPVLNFDSTNTGTTARPNRIGSGSLPASEQGPQNWFNEAAFVSPTAYTFGNSGRNILTGPGLRNLDLGLSRFVSITERTNLEFRAEAFNLFNTPQFGLPNATLGVATAGAISTVVNPQRELQLALRLAF